MAYRPSRKRKHAPQSPQPDVTPVMNLVVVLIPLLLSVAQFVRVSLIDYVPPPAEDVSAVSEEGPDGERGEEQRLDLVVNVLPEGFEVSRFGATRGEHFTRIPLTGGGAHDLERLHDTLVRIKRQVVGAPRDTVAEVDPVSGLVVQRPVFRYVDAQLVSISARGGTDWELVVKVMDAAREYRTEQGVVRPLFPVPRLGQIQ